MSKLPALKYREIKKILINFGFFKVRQKGSHVFFSHGDGRSTVVPNHGTKTIGKGLLREILRDTQLTVGDLTKKKKK